MKFAPFVNQSPGAVCGGAKDALWANGHPYSTEGEAAAFSPVSGLQAACIVPCPGGVRLLRLFGDTPCPSLAPTIDGAPVVEIGPYCFSQKEPPAVAGQRLVGADGSHAICGDFLTELTLPNSVKTLESGAFYDCHSLKSLCVGPGLESLGSDLFTNCRSLAEFRLRCPPNASTGLKRLLGAVSADISAVFLSGSELQARLFYPEYFEWLDENTPAHIFNHSIEGEGYRYRQCFDGGVVNFSEYDAAFARAVVSETPQALCRLALGRLLAPFSLSPAAAEAYRGWLAQNAETSLVEVVAHRNAAALSYLLPILLAGPAEDFGRTILRPAAALCAQAGWSEGAALVLCAGAGGGTASRKRYDFD